MENARAHVVSDDAVFLSDPRWNAVRVWCDCGEVVACMQERFWDSRANGASLQESLERSGARRNCCRALLQQHDV